MRKQVVTLAAGAVIALSSSLVHAVPTIFFGENLNPGNAVSGDPVTARNDFLAGLSGVGSEDFESFAAGTVNPSLTFPGSTGDITATLTGAGSVEIGPNGAGRFATSGTKYYEISGSFTIDFSNPIAAFGFYGTDIGDFNGQVTLTSGAVLNLTIPNTINAPNGSLLFYGFIDTANTISSITFGNTAAGVDFFGFDDLVIGDAQQVVPVPVPGTLALMGLALTGLGFVRRRGQRVK